MNKEKRVGRGYASFCYSFKLIYFVTCSHGQMGQTQVNKEDDNKKTDEELVHLRREIGLLPAVSFIMGTVVGSGIFIAPKGVLMNSGSVGLSLLVWVLCGVLSLFGKMNDISADVSFCFTFFLLLCCALKCFMSKS